MIQKQIQIMKPSPNDTIETTFHLKEQNSDNDSNRSSSPPLKYSQHQDNLIAKKKKKNSNPNDSKISMIQLKRHFI